MPRELGGNSSRARRSLGSKTKSTLAARLKPVPSPKAAELCSAWTGQRPVPTAGAGLSPCFREKHAEPKAQDVIVASLQDSVVAYLYPALTRWAGIFRSYGAEMREVGHSPEG